MTFLRRLLPVWLVAYSRSKLAADLMAGLIVTVLVIPQSLAYALLALIVLHVLAALYHRFVKNDGVLERMIDGRA